MDTPGRMLHLWNGKIKVERRKIPEYFTEWYDEMIVLYGRWRRYGLPFAGGFEEQPGWYIEVMDAFENTRLMKPQKVDNGGFGRATGNNRR